MGHTFTTSGSGTLVTADGGGLSYVAHNTAGETIDVAAKGVRNAYGSSGNDALTGDANANWLAGGMGSDSFSAGAVDDVLLIDASDLQANIHAGAGFDTVQIVGDEGVALNLAQAEVEVVVGGRGDDVLIGGGRANVFVEGGAGDDLIVGGAADDALSGDDGDDLIDGGASDDLLDGGQGDDWLSGGAHTTGKSRDASGNTSYIGMPILSGQ